jgi:hypothetical protein
MAIRAVAIGGISAVWVGSKGGATKLIVSDSKTCMERVLATPSSANGILLAGDRHFLSFVTPKLHGRARAGIDLIRDYPRYQHPLLERRDLSLPTAVRAISADGERVAAMLADDRVEVFTSKGKLIRTLTPGSPRALALRGDELAVLTRADTVEVWNVTTANLEHTWPAPRRATSVDVHFGIVVLAAGRTVYAMRLESGRTVLLARAPRSLHAQIEAIGVVYQYNIGRKGFLRFIPLSAVERKLVSG